MHVQALYDSPSAPWDLCAAFHPVWDGVQPDSQNLPVCQLCVPVSVCVSLCICTLGAETDENKLHWKDNGSCNTLIITWLPSTMLHNEWPALLSQRSLSLSLSCMCLSPPTPFLFIFFYLLTLQSLVKFKLSLLAWNEMNLSVSILAFISLALSIGPNPCSCYNEKQTLLFIWKF